MEKIEQEQDHTIHEKGNKLILLGAGGLFQRLTEIDLGGDEHCLYL
jgi:hypothetical protein